MGQLRWPWTIAGTCKELKGLLIQSFMPVRFDLPLAGLDAGNVQQIVDDVQKVLAAVMNGLHVFSLLRVEAGVESCWFFSASSRAFCSRCSSTCLRSVMSTLMPVIRRIWPLSSLAVSPRPSNQCTVRSGQTARNSAIPP